MGYTYVRHVTSRSPYFMMFHRISNTKIVYFLKKSHFKIFTEKPEFLHFVKTCPQLEGPSVSPINLRLNQLLFSSQADPGVLNDGMTHVVRENQSWPGRDARSRASSAVRAEKHKTDPRVNTLYNRAVLGTLQVQMKKNCTNFPGF